MKFNPLEKMRCLDKLRIMLTLIHCNGYIHIFRSLPNSVACFDMKLWTSCFLIQLCWMIWTSCINQIQLGSSCFIIRYVKLYTYYTWGADFDLLWVLIGTTTPGPLFTIRKYCSMIKISATIPVVRLHDGT